MDSGASRGRGGVTGTDGTEQRFPNRVGHEINRLRAEELTDVAGTQYEAPQRDDDVGALVVYGLRWTALDVKGR